MRNFRLLKADEIECRISTISEKGLSLLLYKTARTDYALLDETIGMMNWQNKYEVIDGKMYCGIGIKEGGGEWIWKWNCGVESNTEAEKGQASDAMKRAGFCWGIGTELYSAPFIWIPADKCNITQGQNGKFVCYDRFYVKEINYTEDEVINSLVIVSKKETVYTYGIASNSATQRKQDTFVEEPRVNYPTKKTAPVSDPDGDFKPQCADCKKTITVKVHDYSVKKFGTPLCYDCQKTHGH